MKIAIACDHAGFPLKQTILEEVRAAVRDALPLPTFLREYDKVARQCAQEGVDHPRYLLRLSERFEFDETNNELIRPKDRRLPYRYRTESKGRECYSYQAAAEDCRHCPARR